MDFIKSPLNYTGGKYKLLKEIVPLFPSDFSIFVDLFAGGYNVGINVDCDMIYCNDNLDYIIEMFECMKETKTSSILEHINNQIDNYSLTKSNVDGYNRFREHYNKTRNPLDLFVLVCYSFNHQIRFNNKHEFNCPLGKERSSYNQNTEKNLIKFVDKMKKQKIIFSKNDFVNFDINLLDKSSFVYCDPPYLISNGSYNDGKRGFKDWTENEERELLELLDRLNKKNIHFALSNVFEHKGIKNEILIEWSKRYKVHHINMNYHNCNYQKKDKKSISDEVLITNY